MTEKKERLYSFEGVREMSREILSNSKDLVEIDPLGIEEVLLPRIHQYLETRNENTWLPEGHDLTLGRELGLNLFLNVINFCYKDPETGHEYFYTSAEGKKINRATGLLTAMARSGVNWEDFAPVSRISNREWKEITQIGESNPMYLGDARGEKVTGFAKFLVNLGYMDITEFLEGCRFNASLIAKELDKSGFFDDKFMKRSQLASRMISEVWVRRGEKAFDDIDKLTIMADYRIPQVFYNLGAVNLVDTDLRNKLLNNLPILPNSREEKALRAAAISVGKIVADKLNVTEAETDNILWGLSQEMVKKAEMIIPHMLVATDAY